MRKRWVWLGLLATLLLTGIGVGAWMYLQVRPVSRAFQPQLVRLKSRWTPTRWQSDCISAN
jgi:hypothetical protein